MLVFLTILITDFVENLVILRTSASAKTNQIKSPIPEKRIITATISVLIIQCDYTGHSGCILKKHELPPGYKQKP